jgi:two-component system, OmpR family, response regulator
MNDIARIEPDLCGPEGLERIVSEPIGTVLLVDDDPDIREMVCGYFKEQGVPTVTGSSRLELKRHLSQSHPSLVLLDLRLGQEDGLDLLREIRANSNIPVIIMTGCCCDEVDRILGLEFGADDYVTKPFRLRELLARARAVLRRQKRGRVPRQSYSSSSGYRFNGWCLEPRLRRLRTPSGQVVSLTNGEYALLLAFVEAPRRTLTREHLRQATRIHEDISDRSIDVQILRLRRKLEGDSSAPRMIKTNRGLGYTFDAETEMF